MKKSKGFVAGHNPSEGKGQFANMPQQVIMSSYPKGHVRPDAELDDTISGIDSCAKESQGKKNRYLSHQK